MFDSVALHGDFRSNALQLVREIFLGHSKTILFLFFFNYFFFDLPLDGVECNLGQLGVFFGEPHLEHRFVEDLSGKEDGLCGIDGHVLRLLFVILDFLASWAVQNVRYSINVILLHLLCVQDRVALALKHLEEAIE